MTTRFFNRVVFGVAFAGLAMTTQAALLVLADAEAESIARKYFRAFEPRPLKLQPAGNHHRFEFITEGLFERNPGLQKDILSPSWNNVEFEDSVQTRLDRAHAFSEAGDLKAAAALYGQVLKRDVENKPAMFGLGVSLAQMGMWPEAIQIYRKLNLLSPGELLVQNNLAYMLISQPHITRIDVLESIQLAQDSIMANPLIPQLWDTLSAAYYVLGDYERAWAAANMAVRLGMGEDIAFGLQRLPAAAIYRYQQQEEKCRIAKEIFTPLI